MRSDYRNSLPLWDKGAANGLDLDQAVLKYEGVHPVGNARLRGISGPFQEENVALIDGLEVPLCLWQRLDQTGEEIANRFLAAQHSRWQDNAGVVSII